MKIIHPENFNLNRPEQFVLVIGIRPDCFSFAIYHPEETHLIFYQELEKQQDEDAFSSFKETFFENDFFGLNYRNVYLVNYSTEFTYVPSLLFESKRKNELMDSLFSEKPKGRILEQTMVTPEMTILHTLSEEIYDFLHRSFPTALFIHYSSGMIHYFMNRKNPESAAQLVLNFREDKMDVFCFREDDFILGNYFEFRDLKDALYFALFTWKQEKMDQLSDSLYVLGDEKMRKEAEIQLKYYIQHIFTSPFASDEHFPAGVPFEILALSQCKFR